ncbi:hypothetical protein K438DRAFT_1823834 [Mycena galopus ATCC 62051]|nr:hypothetical protein K438DRAFT_1823834 [Mycena galopus ATCC 62051]
MPETREAIASGMQAKSTYEAAKAAGASFVLQRIAVDATKSEANRSDASRQAKAGLVYDLKPTSSVKRGSNHNQTHVFPPQLRVTPQNPDPASISTLVLEDIMYTNRALILNFGSLFLMLQYLTHTSVQFYPRDRWDNSICNVSKTVRKFSIGMALVFPEHVLAFPSIDLVFQPTWSTSLAQFDIPPNIYTAPDDFLLVAANWIDSILHAPNDGRACDEIRKNGHIFYGIGVYTVTELFFMAGLSPFLTLYEVFSVPSRAARFMLAFYSYIDRSERDLWSLLHPCIHDGILAPTTEQRLKYADWLYVWAKDRTSMPLRMASLVDEYNNTLEELSHVDGIWCRSDIELYDVFEPTFLAAGLRAMPTLGRLIFGQDTELVSGAEIIDKEDPLTALYRKHNVLGASTRLKPSGFYSPLIIPNAEFRGKNASHRKTFSFRDLKEMWTITKNFPSNCHWSQDANVQSNRLPTRPRELVGQDRLNRLIKFIVANTLKVSIGPLEYCGVGHIVYVGGLPRVAVCKGDPAIPRLHEIRVMRGLNRVSSNLDKPGKGKRARSNKENESLSNALLVIDTGYIRAGKDLTTTENGDTQEPILKKQRMCADQKIALRLV